MASYYEICTLLQNGWTRVYNTEQQVPYVYNGNQWIGYDDTQSLTQKANYIVSKGLGGGMFWALDLDDFAGSFCGNVYIYIYYLIKF
jgi:chitinase